MSVAGLDPNNPDDAIEVEKDEVLEYQMVAQSPFKNHKIDLEIAGICFNVEDYPIDTDPTWSGTVNVDDYATFGVGLYKVTGAGDLASEETCSGAVLIKIKGNPFTTVAGVAAAAAVISGLLLIAGGSIATMREYSKMRQRVEAWADEQVQRVASGQAITGDELAASLRGVARPGPVLHLWMLAALPAFVLMGATMGGGGGMRMAGMSLRLPRIPWRPQVKAIGSLGGILAVEGVLVLLQQFAVTPLTGTNTVGGVFAGLGFAIVVTSTVRWFGGREVNKAIANAEGRLAAEIEKLRRDAGLPPSAPEGDAPPAG